MRPVISCCLPRVSTLSHMAWRNLRGSMVEVLQTLLGNRIQIMLDLGHTHHFGTCHDGHDRCGDKDPSSTRGSNTDIPTLLTVVQ